MRRLIPILTLAGAAVLALPRTSGAESLRAPVRLTAGGSNQSMGVLAPGGGALFFVSDRNATSELFVQDPVDTGPRLLVETNADVGWPQVSPDGKWLAYISTERDATGDLCLAAPDGSDPRCLTGLSSAELQPVWLEGGARLGVLSRDGIHADYRLRAFRPDGSGGKGETVLEGNLLGVAASDDGRWLAWVPLERTSQDVGVSFSNRVGGGLRLVRPGAGGEVVTFKPRLPGVTGFPAFSRDGRALYFSQYLNDTNRDGVIDGDDHSILFRVRFDPEAADPIGSAVPRQLTSAHWNCRYPAPAADRLIMTCSHQGSLDVYALPLDGAVPAGWDAARLRGELAAARNHWTKLLLLARLLELAGGDDAQVDVLRRMVLLHTELGEYEAAATYCDRIRYLAAGVPAAWARLMRELALHRRADIALAHGQLSEEYLASESQRAGRVRRLVDELTGDVQALALLVLSEVQAHTGRRGQGRAIFERVDLEQVRDPLVLRVAAERAREICGLRGDREALLAVFATLARHPGLDAAGRLRYADRFVRELLRGVPRDERRGRVGAWISRVPEESELGLVLRVEDWLLRLDGTEAEEVRAGLFEIYKYNREVERRRALVLRTVQAAARLGSAYLLYQFTNSWVSWLKRSHPERSYAEELYRRVVLERAYQELGDGEVSEARGYFYGATMQTDSLEAHTGFIEAWMAEGRKDVLSTYARRFAKQPEHPAYLFARAYLLARGLEDIQEPLAYRKTLREARGLLDRTAAERPRSAALEQLRGYLRHQVFVRGGDKRDAQAALRHYLLALDLARGNPRQRAALLLQAGLLQAAFGNHRIALRYFQQRDRLADVRPAGTLCLYLAAARSHFHVDAHRAAVEQAERGLALLDARPELGPYRPLVLDRLGLYLLEAGEAERALGIYGELVPLVKDGPPVNRLKAQLGLARSALSAGKHRRALEALQRADQVLASGEALRPEDAGRAPGPFGRHRFGPDDYAILLAGLRARAHRALGELDQAAGAMGRRQELLAARFERTDTDDDLLELARCSHHLAEMAYRRGAHDRARRHLERGLARSDEFNRRTGSGVNPVGLELVRAYAELHLYGGVARAALQRDPGAELHRAYTFICAHPSPRWSAYRFLFELYLSMIRIPDSRTSRRSPARGRVCMPEAVGREPRAYR